MSDRIRQFFEDYGVAFVQRDARAIAGFFGYPSHVTSDVGQVVLVPNSSRDTWELRLQALLEIYASIGLARVEIQKLQSRELSPRLWLVDVNWALLDATGALLYDFDNVYVLAELDGPLRITSAVSQNELSRYTAYLERLKR